MTVKETIIFSSKNGDYVPYFEGVSVSKDHIDNLVGKKLLITVKNFSYNEVVAYFISFDPETTSADFQTVDSVSVDGIYLYSRGGVKYVDIIDNNMVLTFEIHGKDFGKYYTLDTISVKEIDSVLASIDN